MSIQPVSNLSFQGKNPKRGAHTVNQLMSNLYKQAYGSKLFEDRPDFIQVSAKMKDGTNVSAIANFDEIGECCGVRFPFEHVGYKNEFFRTILDKYNHVMTKGKSTKKRNI
jgi:hypothetical protein